jgi:tetratricopeptide (TPR) repeat protein
MLSPNQVSIVAASVFALAGLGKGDTSTPEAINQVTIQSRHLLEVGKWEEAKATLEEHLAKTTDAVEVARLKAEMAHYAVDRNTYFRKDEPSVFAAIENARSALRTIQDETALATLEMAEGRFTYWQALSKTKDWAVPTDHFDRALQIYRELGDNIGLGEAMFYRGLVYQMQDQSKPAREMFDRGLELTKKSGDERMQSFLVRHIGYLQQVAGEIDAARASFRDSLALRQRNDMKVFVPFALIALAEFEAEQKNVTEAISLVEQAIPLSGTGNSPRALYTGRLALAKLYADQGKTAEAKELAVQSRAGANAFGDPDGVKEAEEFLNQNR